MQPFNPLILSNRVIGTDVLTAGGERMGYVDSLSIDKITGEVAFAILAVGGFFGLGERLHPVPWRVLDYEAHKRGFVVAIDWQALRTAPSLDKEQLEELGAGETWRTRVSDYYSRYGAETA